jgi:hypothetical protein
VTVLTIESMEETWDAKGLTLVIHPAVRRAVKPYADSFYIGARSFLSSKGDGLFFLPLRDGYVRLLFSRRTSPMGHAILRIDPVSQHGLARIKADQMQLGS